MQASPASFFPLLFRRWNNHVRRLGYDLAGKIQIRFAVALAQKVIHDDVSNLSASIAYYAFLSLFPLLLSLLAIFGIFLPSDSAQHQLINFLAQYLPGSLSILENNIPDIIRFRSAFGIVGIIGLIWAGTGVFSSVTNAINKAWDIRYKHPFYIKKPREIGMVLGTGLLFLFSFGASTVLSFIGKISLPVSGALANVGTAVIAFLFSLVIFMLIHKFAPAVWVNWRHVWPGALLSTILFEIAKTFFVFYINHSPHFDKIYGSIASVIILLVWIYYSAFILVLGAEFNCLLFRIKREGDTFDKPGDKLETLKEL